MNRRSSTALVLVVAVGAAFTAACDAKLTDGEVRGTCAGSMREKYGRDATVISLELTRVSPRHVTADGKASVPRAAGLPPNTVEFTCDVVGTDGSERVQIN